MGTMPMRNGFHARLDDRGVVRIAGPDAEGFLQNIVTTDMSRVADGRAGFGALLTPQGKILVDFLVFPDGEGYLIDLPAAAVADFVKRMTLYRLRARVTVADESATRAVFVFWGGAAPRVAGAVAADPRLAALGWRGILAGHAVPDDSEAADAAAWQAHRIALGVPEGGRDFAFGDAFPHDADMDDLGGLDFRKGCYVGQEIVARMQHRGTARRRAVQVRAASPLPAAGTAIEAAGRRLCDPGEMGTLFKALAIAAPGAAAPAGFAPAALAAGGLGTE